ncbi:hypothetical protein C8J40_102227 [Sphingomonas sp. PP-CC-3A-396]|nr:hypothetical protein C8J40_102227 [Sphingomonas sp. PP-CC-3A-396]
MVKTASVVLSALCLATPAMAQQTHVSPKPAPAIGYDWNDDSSADDRVQQTLWPRSDASAAGLDDMIHTEQTPIRAAIREDGGFGSRALHGIRKVGGDYIVVPVLKIHLGHPRQATP